MIQLQTKPVSTWPPTQLNQPCPPNSSPSSAAATLQSSSPVASLASATVPPTSPSHTNHYPNSTSTCSPTPATLLSSFLSLAFPTVFPVFKSPAPAFKPFPCTSLFSDCLLTAVIAFGIGLWTGSTSAHSQWLFARLGIGRHFETLMLSKALHSSNAQSCTLGPASQFWFSALHLTCPLSLSTLDCSAQRFPIRQASHASFILLTVAFLVHDASQRFQLWLVSGFSSCHRSPASVYAQSLISKQVPSSVNTTSLGRPDSRAPAP